MDNCEDKELSSEQMTEIISDISTNISNLQMSVTALSANTTERINILQSTVEELRLKNRGGRGKVKGKDIEESNTDINFKNSTINAINSISHTVTNLQKSFATLSSTLSGQTGIDITTINSTLSDIQTELLGKEDVSNKVTVIDPLEKRPSVYPNVVSLLNYLDTYGSGSGQGSGIIQASDIASDILAAPIKQIPGTSDVLGYVDTTNNTLAGITVAQLLSWIESNLGSIAFVTPSQLNNLLNSALVNYPTNSQLTNVINMTLVGVPVIRHYVIQDPSLVWTINHNMNTTSYSVTLKDADGDMFYAKVKAIDNNTFEVYLTTALSGTVDVLFNLT